MTQTRRKSHDDPGHAHFLTFSCYRRCQLLTTDPALSLLAKAIDRARAQHDFDLWSYVFMPEHVHLLIRPRNEKYSVSRILKSIKGISASWLLSHWKRRCPTTLRRLEVQTAKGVVHRVWQRGGGFDRNLYTHDLIRRAVAYIEYNPVRKGLVTEPTEWKWSSAHAHSDESDIPLRVDETHWELIDAAHGSPG